MNDKDTIKLFQEKTVEVAFEKKNEEIQSMIDEVENLIRESDITLSKAIGLLMMLVFKFQLESVELIEEDEYE